jgi:hypothetical protein
LTALEALVKDTSGPNALTISQRAQTALLSGSRWHLQQLARTATAGPHIPSITIVHPAGQPLPNGFLEQNWNAVKPNYMLPQCLTHSTVTCDAVLTDLDGDGKAEILLFANSGSAAAAFKTNGSGTWELLGTISNATCTGVRNALKNGRFDAVTPALKDIEAAGQRLHVNIACNPPRR